MSMKTTICIQLLHTTLTITDPSISGRTSVWASICHKPAPPTKVQKMIQADVNENGLVCTQQLNSLAHSQS
ncbi:hypothetical protein J4Q44_G00354170 [Coregonus suidteri]|uniref:Uncharacterized protein n=1 Tax=Coregonus suidteri TaxID=861788 RepID=A0AAN8KLG5_9TELE